MTTDIEQRMCIRCFKRFTPELVLTDAGDRDWCNPCAKWILSRVSVSKSMFWDDPDGTDPIPTDVIS